MKSVHFLGLAGKIFSTGLYDVAEKVGGKVFLWTQWKTVGKQIVANNKSGNYTGSIAITGHSLGARAAIKLANYLTRHGIKVDLLICLDYVYRLWCNDLRVENSDIPAYHLRSRDHRAVALYYKPKIRAQEFKYNISHIALDNDKIAQKQIYKLYENHT